MLAEVWVVVLRKIRGGEIREEAITLSAESVDGSEEGIAWFFISVLQVRHPPVCSSHPNVPTALIDAYLPAPSSIAALLSNLFRRVLTSSINHTTDSSCSSMGEGLWV